MHLPQPGDPESVEGKRAWLGHGGHMSHDKEGVFSLLSL